jgi:hypothetical protein
MIDLPRSPRKATGEKGRLAVVTCHFNWSGYSRPVENLRRFLRQMDWMGVPVFGIELAHNKDSFVTTGNPNWTRYSVQDDSILFQKEACINAAVRALPGGFDKVAWIDADLEFSNKHVFDIASGLLSTLKVVQLFDSAVWTDHLGVENKRALSCIQTGMDRRWLGHPGFAWAARRDLWDNGGLYALTPVGHGDTVFALTVTNGEMRDPFTSGNHYGVGCNARLHDAWSGGVRQWLEGKTGIVPGECWHAWHGNLKNRQYQTRSEVLRVFDVEEHLELDERGLLRWTEKAPATMRKYVFDYFKNRHEDTP